MEPFRPGQMLACLDPGSRAGFSEGSFPPAHPTFCLRSLSFFPLCSLSPTEQREQMRARGPSHPLRHMEVISSVSVITQELLCNGPGFYCTETNPFLHKTSLWFLLRGLPGQVLAGIKDPQQPVGTPGRAGQSVGGRGGSCGCGEGAARAPSKNQQLWEGGREHRKTLTPSRDS